jgi:hypothetical protein
MTIGRSSIIGRVPPSTYSRTARETSRRDISVPDRQTSNRRSFTADADAVPILEHSNVPFVLISPPQIVTVSAAQRLIVLAPITIPLD